MRENPTQPQSPLNERGQCVVAEDACTVQVDSGAGGGGRFATASTDGSRVFFSKGALYEYDVETGSTTDLSGGVAVEGVLEPVKMARMCISSSRAAACISSTMANRRGTLRRSLRAISMRLTRIVEGTAAPHVVHSWAIRNQACHARQLRWPRAEKPSCSCLRKSHGLSGERLGRGVRLRGARRGAPVLRLLRSQR